jgi:hypothetical protein
VIDRQPLKIQFLKHKLGYLHHQIETITSIANIISPDS